MPATIVAQKEWAKGERSKMVLTRGTWRKKDYIDLREHFLVGENGTSKWLPTKRGVRLSVKDAENITAALWLVLELDRPQNKPTTRVVKRGKRGRAGWAPNVVCYECIRDQAHRYQHPLPKSERMAEAFRYAVYMPYHLQGAARTKDAVLQVALAKMPVKLCCGMPMGIMQDVYSKDAWRYQCQASQKHSESVVKAA